MKIDLKGKKALITGSTKGIGLAIAKNLAEAGAKVYLNGRSEEGLEKAKEQILTDFPRADIVTVAADLQDQEGAEIIFKQILDIDILINNLGIFEPTPFFEITDSIWLKFFNVNFMSAVRMTRHFTPGMVQKKWGRVIFISSESAIQIPVEMIHYGMTKTALLALSRGLAETVAGTGVTVNTVMPGPTKTEGVELFVRQLAADPQKNFEELEKEFFTHFRPNSLIKRFVTPKEVANLVTYIASPEASGTTGSTLRVDGGLAQSLL
ncbi:SDR family NAD(P)-dependent oxidoreductase [Legionella sp. CNM-1927-20]|uniref:SDR family NAD(P)-dependent oxidoreductase n=1 Tax=Legionella sp. CNM-1927-20 TaxID=3422221 RepID=UPI00403B14F9